MKKTQFIKIFLVFSICVLSIAVLSVYFTFSLRHHLGMKYIEQYPVSLSVIKNIEVIQSDLGHQPYKTAPTLKMFRFKDAKKAPYYIMEVEVKTEEGKHGKVQISMYSSPKETSEVSYTLSWSIDGKSHDLFGVYDPKRKEKLEKLHRELEERKALIRSQGLCYDDGDCDGDSWCHRDSGECIVVDPWENESLEYQGEQFEYKGKMGK